MKASIKDLLDFWIIKGDGLELILIIVVKVGESFPAIVQDDPNQGLALLVEDLPKGEGFLRSVRQQAEEEGDGVVRWQPLGMDIPCGL